MRLLFELPEAGHLRMYGSTIRLLADRGHQVLLSYDAPGKRRTDAAAALEELPGVAIVPPIPPRRRLRRSVERLRIAIDYLRFVDARFADAPELRRRMEKYAARSAAPLLRVRAPRLASALMRGLLAIERLVPSDSAVEHYLGTHAPDVVVVTPLIARGSSGVKQTDTVKSALALRIPVVVGVSSWDHLTTKGLFKSVPDRVLVWNDVQRLEAVELHRLPPERVVVTGAQLFDRWFELEPTLDREAFAEESGLNPKAPYVLYVGSSPNVAPPELEIPFVLRWIEALRRRQPELGVLVRPHPGNVATWAGVDVARFGNAVIRPRERPGLPMGEQDERLYLHSLRHAHVVVGLNTSAEIESLIQRRPVLTLTPPEFAETQAAPPHFRYLLDGSGGCVRIASDLALHLDQLDELIADPESRRPQIDEFLRAFVRPHGLAVAATPVVADAIEALA